MIIKCFKIILCCHKQNCGHFDKIQLTILNHSFKKIQIACNIQWSIFYVYCMA